MEVPISYEGLYEVCALCGSNAHDLDACPETPKGPLEVIVEKFGATSLQTESGSGTKAAPSSVVLPEKWVTVSPKKRGRFFPSSRKKNPSKFVGTPGPPSVKIVSSCSSPAHAAGVSTKDGGLGLLSIPPSIKVATSCPDLTVTMVPDVGPEAAAAQTEPLVGAAGPSCIATPFAPASSDLLKPAPPSPQQFLSSPNSPREGTDMEDEDIDMFLNLEPDDEVQLSSESTKKRKLVMGDASSPSYSSN